MREGGALVPTIRDLSQYTGLAFGTVSKYLNGGNVRPENRAVLDEAVAKLHYRMNYAARALKRQRTNTIGVVLPASSLAGSGTMLTALDRTLAEEGIGGIWFSPLAQGLLSDRYLSGSVPAGSLASMQHLRSAILSGPASCSCNCGRSTDWRSDGCT